MTARPHMSTRRRRHLFRHHGGSCWRCGHDIDPVRERWEISHVIPWEISRDDSDENCKPEHYRCHRDATAAEDIPAIAKVKRQEDRHYGFHVASRPMDGGYRSPWRKRMDGTVERRR